MEWQDPTTVMATSASIPFLSRNHSSGRAAHENSSSAHDESSNNGIEDELEVLGYWMRSGHLTEDLKLPTPKTHCYSEHIHSVTGKSDRLHSPSGVYGKLCWNTIICLLFTWSYHYMNEMGASVCISCHLTLLKTRTMRLMRQEPRWQDALVASV